MALIFIDGFTKYRQIAAALFGDDWTSNYGNPVVDGYTGNFRAGAFGGDSFECGENSGLYKALPSTYTTLIWGLRFNTPVLNGFAVSVDDTTTNQFTLRTDSGGFIEAYRGGPGGSFAQGGTLLQTSTATININAWHYLECQVTISSSVGTYHVYLDNTLIMTNSGVNTQATSNAYCNSFSFYSCDAQLGMLVDDLYICDTTGTVNNTVLGDSVVETQFPVSDSSVQFSVGASSFGTPYSYVGGSTPTGANVLVLRAFTPSENCIINSISVIPENTNLSAKYKMVIYSNSGGAPHTLMSTGTEIVGTTTGVPLTGNLVSPQTLTGGSQYWLGFITDTSINMQINDSLSLYGFTAANTYTSGAPGTAPTMTGNQADWCMWGNVTSTSNFSEVNQLPLTTQINYLTNTAVGNEDQYNFPALSLNPLHVWGVKVSAYAAKSDAGSRNISLMVKSGATDDPGNFTAQALTASYQYYYSHWNLNPNTGLAWTYSTVNNATSGMKIVS
jgi:hypothetical protein